MKRSVIKYLFFLFGGLFLSVNGHGQSSGSTIRGLVTDTSGHVLKFATVALYAGKVLQKQMATTEKGFEFNSLAAGRYMITMSFSGYSTDTLHVAVSGNDTVINTGRARLKVKPIALKEVEIRSEVPPITLKGDTIVYDATVFKTPPNSTVEELIKALPGLQVDDNGVITYQGKVIQYIAINGRQYFLNDPKQISRNLFSDMVSKVELFDAPSKESKITGVKDLDPGKALNLVIKKGVSLAINGKIYGGSTGQGGYTTGATASSFVDNRAMLANVNTNNLNNLYIGQDGLGDLPLGAQGKSTNTSSGLTYSNKLSKFLSLNLNYGNGFNNTKTITSSTQQTFYPDSTQVSLNSNSSTSTGFNQSLVGEVQLALDTLSESVIDYKPNINIGQNKNVSRSSSAQYIQSGGSQYQSSSGTTNNVSNDHNNNIAGEFIFIKSWKKRALSLNFSHENIIGSSDGTLNSDTRFYNPDGSILQDQQISQQFKQSTTTNTYNFNLTDNEKISEAQNLSFSYLANLQNDLTKRNSYDFNTATNSYDLLDTLTTNNLKNSNATQALNIGYGYGTGNFNYHIGGGLQHVLLESDDFIKDNFLEKGFLNWTGNASLFYKLGKKAAGTKQPGPAEAFSAFNNAVTKQINLDYGISTTSPNLQQWRPLPDISNPLFIQTGNPDLKPEEDHALTLRYSSTQPKKGQSFQLIFTGHYRVNAIVPTIDLLPNGVQRTGYVNVSGLYDGSGSANFEFPFGNVKYGTIRISNFAGYLQDIGLVNGDKNIREGLNFGQQFSARYRKGSKLNLYVSGNWKYDGSHYSLQPDRNTASFTQSYRIGGGYTLPWNTQISSNYGISFFGAQAGLPATHTMLWNAALVKNVFKNNRGEFRFTGFDLLNSNNGISQRANGNSVYRNETNTPGRQLLLTFAYYFRPSQQQ